MRRFTVPTIRPARSSFGNGRMTMRNRLSTMVAALLLISGGALAQEAQTVAAPGQDIPKTTATEGSDAGAEFGLTNQIEFGLRGTVFGEGSDKARFQHYQDFRDGGTLDRFRWAKSTNGYVFKAEADHLGYHNQRFLGSYNNHGKVKASFEWNQIPLYFSDS